MQPPFLTDYRCKGNVLWRFSLQGGIGFFEVAVFPRYERNRAKFFPVNKLDSTVYLEEAEGDPIQF